MRSNDIKSLFASAGLTLGVLAAPAALAQTSPPCTPADKAAGNCQALSVPPQPAATSVQELVVTGTRIRTTEYTSPSPITVITPEQAELRGATDIAQILQQTPEAENTLQINNTLTGFVVGGGPGVNTLSLRGLGAQRTLFLIDGQRLGPAGVGGTVGPVDLNTLAFPLAEIENVQILRDGASSIYGSDAIGGVVNIITKKNFNGLDMRAYASQAQGAGGNQYQVDVLAGKTWDRGYVTIGASWYKQEALRVGERPYLSCSQFLATSPATGPADPIDPTTGNYKCENTFTNAVEDLSDGVVYRPFASAVAGGGDQGLDIPAWQAVGLVYPGNPAKTLASYALIPYNTPVFLNTTAISPDERYMFNVFGQYDLSPHAQLYGSLMLTRRDSSQYQVDQFFTPVNPGNVFNPGFGFPLPIIPLIYNDSQQVDYGRILAGVKGDIGSWKNFTNWNYYFNGEFSQSHGYYTQPFAYQDRVNAAAGSANAAGCDPNANIDGGYTMAQLEPNVACVPVNYFQAVQNGQFTPTEQAFLFGRETGWTIYNHYYVEGSANGNVLRLPGGEAALALGFQLRREEIDDNPGTNAQISNYYNYSTTGRTHGSDTVEEAFGELNMPLLKDEPFVKSLVFDVSGRFSHYKSYGSSLTYKIGLNWQITDFLELRATQNTGFRAPALFELYLADQTSFLGQNAIDPCINYGISGISANVQKNCASQGLPPNYTGANSSSATILTGGGVGNLKAETSLSRTVGFVLTPKWFGLHLNAQVDYFTFDIQNQIQQFGAANIIFACYNATDFPNDPFCKLFTRNLTPGTPNYQGITLVKDNFVNVADQREQGLDFDLEQWVNLPDDIKFTVDSHLSWTFYQSTILLGGVVNNFLGEVTQPPFVGNINFRFDKGPWTFNWFLNMIGHTSDLKFVSSIDPNFLQSGEAVYFNHVEPFYTTSDISLSYRKDGYTVRVGVSNLFDKTPGLYGAEGFQNRIGNVPLATQYDWTGRAFFADIEKKFF
ncbi:MAG: TonB-dependent receptor plug domain-containing protein [Caulobacteraceae bacterium]